MSLADELLEKAAAPQFLRQKHASGGSMKAWILPNSRLMPLQGKWHHQSILDGLGDEFDVDLAGVDKSSDQEVRVAALKAGFVRINLPPRGGDLIIELDQKYLRKHKNALWDLCFDVVDSIPSVSITLLNTQVKPARVVSSQSVHLVGIPSRARMDKIPFINEDKCI